MALVALVATVQVVQQVRHNAAAQDAVLHRALTTWPTVLQPQAGASAMEQAPAVWFRESSLDGERLAGSADLPRVPPSEPVQGQGSVHFYLAQVGDQLVRVAATLHQPAVAGGGQGAAPPVVRQVARPFSERLPSVARLMDEGAGLRPVVLLALAMTAGGDGAGARRVGLAAARGCVAHSANPARCRRHRPGYEGPSELAPAVQHFGELQQSQSRWIEEQRRFLADATHQLRTPMAVLRTQLQSAIAGDVLVADALQQMLHTVDRASGLANQLLSLSKVEQLQRMGELPAWI